MGKKYFFIGVIILVIISGCIQQQQNQISEKIQEQEMSLQLGEAANFVNGYGIKFTEYTFVDCPSGFDDYPYLNAEEVGLNAEEVGFVFTLLDKDGLPQKDDLGITKSVVICKGESRRIPEIGNIQVTLLDFNFTKYPTGKPEIPAVVKFSIKP